MNPQLRDLIKHARREARLPDIVGERCVYALVETASCQACIEACPQSAWVLNDDSLGLDTEACDGCGLCTPVCPQGAIITHHEIVLREWKGETVAVCACEQAEPGSENGVIPCIHSIGLQDVLHLYKRGIRYFAVATLDCDACPRGAGDWLTVRLKMINGILRHSGYQEIRLSYWPLTSWERLIREEPATPTGPSFNRRDFLRSFATSVVQQGLELTTLSADKQSSFVPPGLLLPSLTEDTQWPYLPEIDAALCNGCDSCIKLCPHQAIILEKQHGGSCYRLDPQRCSGCKICTDVCEQHAVSIQQWKSQSEQQIAMQNIHCKACGVDFHVPAEQPWSGGDLCQVCSRANQYNNLFQVL